MQDADFLFVVAEVAVAFAGFASIVAVLGQRTTRDHPRMDAFRLRGLLECSLIVVAFALVPYVLGRTPLGEATSWRVSSVLFLVSGILAIRSTLMRRRVIADIPASSWIRLTIFALYLAPPPALFLVAIGLFEIWGPAVYLVCLLSYLLAGGIGFFRVMVSFIAAVRE